MPDAVLLPCLGGQEFEYRPNHTALLLIDMQRDFCCEGGYFATLAGSESIAPFRAVIPATRRVLAHARSQGLAVIHTREGHRPDLSDCPAAKLNRTRRAGAAIGSRGPMGRLLVRGEPGHDFVDELRPLPSEIVIDKPGYSAFYATELADVLHERRISHLVLAGITTDVCVHSTLREAVDRGFACLTIADATAAADPAIHDAAIAMIQGEGGIFGQVATVEAFCSAAAPAALAARVDRTRA